MIESRRDGAEGCPGLRRGLFPAVPAGLGRPCKSNPGLASWAKFSRPCGTEFGNGVLTHALKAGFAGWLPVWGRSAVGEIVRGKRGMRGNSRFAPQWRLQQLPSSM